MQKIIEYLMKIVEYFIPIKTLPCYNVDTS